MSTHCHGIKKFTSDTYCGGDTLYAISIDISAGIGTVKQQLKYRDIGRGGVGDDHLAQ
jgi:hypothetical protein